MRQGENVLQLSTVQTYVCQRLLPAGGDLEGTVAQGEAGKATASCQYN